MKITKNFRLQEFIPEEVWKRLGENGLWLIDEDIIKVAQNIRDYFKKPMYINTWVFRTGDLSKRFKWRGFRPSKYTKGAYFSQHKLGKAIDFNIPGLTPQEIQTALCRRMKTVGIKAIELGTPTWTHVDVRNCKEPMQIKYKRTKVTRIR
jgi:hypothetical protein